MFFVIVNYLFGALGLILPGGIGFIATALYLATWLRLFVQTSGVLLYTITLRGSRGFFAGNDFTVVHCPLLL